MENYKRGKQVEVVIDKSKMAMLNVAEDFVWMKDDAYLSSTDIIIIRGKFCLFSVILKMIESKDLVGIYHFERSRFEVVVFHHVQPKPFPRVAPGSKMRKLLEVAIKSMGEGKQVVWTGVGISMGKAISCAEILKRKFKAHQITKICYTKVEDYWDPYDPELETLIVQREIPTIHILISREPLDANEIGYQAPLEYDAFWKSSISPSKSTPAQKHPGAKKRAQFFKRVTSEN